MSSQTPQITQLIVNDIANSQLSSYQIAYKYHISNTSVDHIGRSHLGDILYDQKEQLARQKLNEDIQTLKDKGLSSNKIGEKLGVYKLTKFSLGTYYSEVVEGLKELLNAMNIPVPSDEVEHEPYEDDIKADLKDDFEREITTVEELSDLSKLA